MVVAEQSVLEAVFTVLDSQVQNGKLDGSELLDTVVEALLANYVLDEEDSAATMREVAKRNLSQCSMKYGTRVEVGV